MPNTLLDNAFSIALTDNGYVEEVARSKVADDLDRLEQAIADFDNRPTESKPDHAYTLCKRGRMAICGVIDESLRVDVSPEHYSRLTTALRQAVQAIAELPQSGEEPISFYLRNLRYRLRVATVLAESGIKEAVRVLREEEPS